MGNPALMSQCQRGVRMGCALAALSVILWGASGCNSGSGSPAPGVTPIAIVPGGTIGRVVFADGDTAQGGQGATIDNIPCDLAPPGYHIHAHVSLFVNGQQDAIPVEIGITNACLYHLHTHDASGTIHIEAPSPQTFTIGQFFDIWGQPLTTTNVAGFTGPVTVFVNGAPYSGDPGAIVLTSHEEITLEVGTTVTPPTYSWPAGY